MTRSSPASKIRLAVLFLTVCFWAPSAGIAMAADEAPLTDAEVAVQGKWIRRVETPNGQFTIIKEHKRRTTQLTTFDPRQNVVYSKTSQFQLDKAGDVRIFTFFNSTITAGPQAGLKIAKPSSYIYRVINDRFIEVRGVLDEDTETPAMIIWQRVDEEKPQGDAT